MAYPIQKVSPAQVFFYSLDHDAINWASVLSRKRFS